MNTVQTFLLPHGVSLEKETPRPVPLPRMLSIFFLQYQRARCFQCIVMLNQAASDRDRLAHLLGISQEQMSYVTNADAGCGLLRYGNALAPFINKFPKDTKLYELITTKPHEGVFSQNQH